MNRENLASRVHLSLLHIKLGLMKQFVKTPTRKSSESFEYVKANFEKVTEAKLNEGVYVCSQITTLLTIKTCSQH